MIDRRADDRQAGGHVDAGVQSQHLDRDVSLVVVHRHYYVELTSAGTIEDGIRGPGATCVDPLVPGCADGRLDFPDILFAEQAVLAGMAIESGHGDLRT